MLGEYYMFIVKKFQYYIGAIIAIILVCLTTTFATLNCELYSTLQMMLLFSGRILIDNHISVDSQIYSCLNVWLCLIMSVVVSIPSLTNVCDELKCRQYMSVEIREGRRRYIYSRCIYSLLSAAITVTIALIIYSVLISLKIPVDINSYNIYAVGQELLLVILQCSLYGAAFSLFGMLCALIYPDVLFDLCIIYIAAYFTKNLFVDNVLWFPAATIIILIVVIGTTWKVWEKRL